MSNSTAVELQCGAGGWQPVTPHGVTDYGCAVTVPATCKIGTGIWVRAGSDGQYVRAGGGVGAGGSLTPWGWARAGGGMGWTYGLVRTCEDL